MVLVLAMDLWFEGFCGGRFMEEFMGFYEGCCLSGLE